MVLSVDFGDIAIMPEKLILTDLIDRVVLEIISDRRKLNIDIHHLPSGLYLLTTPNRMEKAIKVVKE